MRPQRRTIILYTRFGFALLAFVLVLVLLIRGASSSSTTHKSRFAPPQDDEKSLDIERYPNEPVELVDVKIRERSVKDKIRTKLKDARNRPVLDHVSFKEHNDWFKSVKIRVRNVSDRSICGMDVHLYFKPDSMQMAFKMELKPKSLRNLYKEPLPSGEEIDLEVSEDSVNQALQYMFRHGVDVNQSKAYLSVHTVYFSEDFGWGQGSFLRRDPYNPSNWHAVDKPEPQPPPSPSPASFEANRVFQPVGFKYFGTKSLSAPAQFLNRCQAARAGLISWACNTDESNTCDTISEQGNGAAGYLSSVGELGNCIYRPGPTQTTCATQTTNYFLRFDESCATPSPTPTLSCLPEGYVYLVGGIPCCQGLTPIDGICAVPSPTPDPCSFIAPPTCPPGQIWIRALYPFCYQCITNPFPSFSPTPNSSPTPIRLPNGWTCFTDSGCLSGYCGPDFRCAPPPSPTPTPEPTCEMNPQDQHDGCMSEACIDCYRNGGVYCTGDGGNCWTPIIIDIDGQGLDLTNAFNGANFDLNANGITERVAWTSAGSDDAFLVLDRNGDAIINNGKELFGNFAEQMASSDPNGFWALAEFDKAANGGNGDGVIDSRDAIFTSLRLWQDINHNGLSEVYELYSLTEIGVESISLDFRTSWRRDRWGNTFRYRAKIYGTNHQDLGRWAYDVFLLTAPVQRANEQQIARLVSLDIRRLLGVADLNEITSTRRWRWKS